MSKINVSIVTVVNVVLIMNTVNRFQPALAGQRHVLFTIKFLFTTLAVMPLTVTLITAHDANKVLNANEECTNFLCNITHLILLLSQSSYMYIILWLRTLKICTSCICCYKVLSRFHG